jgi:hypothetical protein
MFFKKEDKPFIKFRHREDHAMLDKPAKASKNLPNWFKHLKRVIPGEHKNAPGTIKRCVPVLDAATQGYIIPSWCDWHIKVSEEEVKVTNEDGTETTTREARIGISSAGDMRLGDMISGHGWQQVGDDCPIKHYPLGKTLMKFTNPWVVETSPGWSCLFKTPSNHYSNIRIMEGVVDTDTYRRQVNFPFFWDGCNTGEFEIKKGSPLIHVIPFKRQELELKFDTWDHEYMNMMDTIHESHFFDKYRRLWWHKRNT